VTGSFGRSLQVVSADARSMTSQLSVDGDCPPQTRSFEKPFGKRDVKYFFSINCKILNILIQNQGITL
jgi:hypothetical protein